MKRSLVMVFAILLIISSAANSQQGMIIGYNGYDYNFLGGGARAEGMGKAFLATSDDVTGGGWNPAGIYEIDKPVIGITWGMLNPKGMTITESVSDRTELDHFGSFNNVSSVNFAAPFRLKGHPIVFSLNYTRNFDEFQQYGFERNFDSTIGFQGIVGIDSVLIPYHQDVQYRLDGGVNSLDFAIGTRISGKYSIGLAANIHTGNTVFELNQNTIAEGWHYQVIQVADSNTVITILDTNKYSGINFTLGAKYNGDRFDAGLTFRTGFELKEDREIAIYQITRFNGLISDRGTDTVYFNDILFKYQMPYMVSLGFAYDVSENWRLGADFELRPFDGKKVLWRESVTINPGSDNIESYLEIDPVWSNSLSVRLGSEFMKDMSFGSVPIRAGFSYVPIPDPAIDSDGNFNTVVSYTMALGTGLHWDQIHLDMAYSYQFKDRDMSAALTEFQYRNHHFGLSFTGVF